jgi:hypothetical protein
MGGLSGSTYALHIPRIFEEVEAVGVSKEAKTAGQSCKVSVNAPIVSGLSGLVSGSRYYSFDGGYSLNTTVSPNIMGLALSSSDLLPTRFITQLPSLTITSTANSTMLGSGVLLASGGASFAKDVSVGGNMTFGSFSTSITNTYNHIMFYLGNATGNGYIFGYQGTDTNYYMNMGYDFDGSRNISPNNLGSRISCGAAAVSMAVSTAAGANPADKFVLSSSTITAYNPMGIISSGTQLTLNSAATNPGMRFTMDTYGGMAIGMQNGTSADTNANITIDPPVYEDQLFLRENLGSGTSTPAPATINTMTFLGFAADTTDTINFVCQMPHSFKPGGTVRPHVHYMSLTAPGTLPNIGWALTYRLMGAMGDTNSFNVTPSTSSGTQAMTSGTSSYIFHMCNLQDIVISATYGHSALIVGRLNRTQPVNSYAGVIYYVSFDLHYPRDRLGSRVNP